ncbi:MAG: HAMP domain-containing protein [Acidobacteria bacterium]|nr:HAMP domain-containing protein [Acidobacteriota bacterium]MBI3658000.1 HAMP domain-containing protein [Acidobacteriota bacterium]
MVDSGKGNGQPEADPPVSYTGRWAHRSAHKALKFYLIAFLVVCGAFVATQLVLEHANLESPRFNQQALLLLIFSVFNFIVLFGLAIVLARNLVKLYFERKSRRLGSKFKVKLVAAFLGISVMQVGLLSYLAYGLINKSIERWFSLPAYEILDKAKDITEHYYKTTAENLKYPSHRIVEGLRVQGITQTSDLPKLSDILPDEEVLYKLDRIEVYTPDWQRVYPAEEPATDRSPSEIESIVQEGLAGRASANITRSRNGDRFRYGAPLFDAENSSVIAVLITETHVPLSVSQIGAFVASASAKYQALKKNKNIIRTNYIVVLALTSLMILFCFAWLAIYISKQITRPVQALAEGAEQVAAGNLAYRIECPANDELEILIDSFNRMTHELGESKRRLDETNRALQQTNVELEQRRRYIETVLQNITTGVIAIDREGVMHAINQSAQRMLRLDDTAIGRNIKEGFPGRLCQEINRLMWQRPWQGARGSDLALELDGSVIHLALALMPLSDAKVNRHTGYVIVLDDLTELNRAEKSAAWQEVARRLAHEIKNPLTPIQLSAERIQRRFAHLCQANGNRGHGVRPESESLEAYAVTLEECIQTIIDESNGLRRLIDEFSQFARLPQSSLSSADLHLVIENALGLYQDRLLDVQVVRNFDTQIPLLKLDAEQMKRVFVNLIDNALEAMEQANPKILTLRTLLNAEAGAVVIEVSDNGHGIAKGNRADLFLPYFSTRPRGTGLGLAIVQQVISDHQGYIKALDNEPGGARFVINLPINT